MAGRNIVISDQGTLTFTEDEYDAVTDGSVSIQGPESIGTSYTLKLPAAKGSTGQVLSTSTAGSVCTLGFSNPSEVAMAGLNVLFQVPGDDDGADDVTDDIAELIEDSHTSSASDGNNRVIFPAGTYQFSDLGKVGGAAACFTSDNSYWLEGAGMGMTTIRNVASATDPIIQYGEAGSGYGSGVAESRMFVIKDMTIDGNDCTVTTGMSAINLRADYIVIDNVEFTNMGPALRIVGSPKLVAITNCRFDGMKANTGVTEDFGLVRMDEVTGDETTFVFTNNYMVGGTPTVAGEGQGGIDCVSDGTAKSVRCFIRGNTFSELGNSTKAAVNIKYGNDSIIEGNTFSSCIGGAIRSIDSERITIANNKIVSDSAKIAASVSGIYADSDGENVIGIDIVGNEILTAGGIDVGIDVAGDADGVAKSVTDVTVGDNVIDGAPVSISLDDVAGRVSLVNNTCRNSGNIAPHYAAMYIKNLIGDAKVVVEGNVFAGGGNSGRAFYLDRNNPGGLVTNTPGNVDFVLNNNSVIAMGVATAFVKGTVGDMAHIFINGHATDSVLNHFSASGNSYDFTGSKTGSYGLYVNRFVISCVFDSVLEFGASDDVTDCTMALNRAGLAAGEGGSIYIPAGTYSCTDNGDRLEESTDASVAATEEIITVVASGQVWHGEGIIFDKTTPASLTGIDCKTFKTTVRGLTFSHDGGDAPDNIGINGSDQDGDLFENCTVVHANTGIVVNGDHATVRDCSVTDLYNGMGVEIKSGASDAIVTCNHITSSSADDDDIGIGGKCVRANITNNVVRNAGGIAIKLTYGSEGTIISNNELSGYGDGGILLNGGGGGLACTNISVLGNTLSSTTAYQELANEDIAASGLKDSSISNNHITSRHTHIEVSSAAATSENIVVSGNILVNNHTEVDEYGMGIVLQNVNDSIVANNFLRWVSGGGDDCIAISLDTSNRCLVTNNSIHDALVGISILAGAEDNRLVNNIMVDVEQEVIDTSGASTPSIFTGSVSEIGADIIRIGGGGYLGTFENAGSATQWGHVDPLIVYHDADDLTAAGSPDGEEIQTISVTNSFHHVTRYGTDSGNALIETIKINGNHTRITEKGGNTGQANACSGYDGMILFLSIVQSANDAGVVMTVTQEILNDPTAGSTAHVVDDAKNIIGNRRTSAVNSDTIPHVSHTGDLWMFRFEHDGSEGVWRLLNINSEMDWANRT